MSNQRRITALVASLGLAGCYTSEGPAAATAASGDDLADAGVAADGGSPGTAASGTAASASGTLTAAEQSRLGYMVEEEKLARDVYRLHAAQLRVFANIASAEQRHMDAALALVYRYGLANPAAGRAQGSFTDAKLQALYDQLAARSRVSTIEALRVGAEIEELDLIDLDQALAETGHGDVAQVYDALAQGSRDHLAAFCRNLAARGEGCTPQHLDAADFDAIVGR